MSLKLLVEECKAAASALPKRYEDYDINELADNYCVALDNNDNLYIEIYSSALFLRFFYQLDNMYQKCKTSGIDRAELASRLFDCIKIACEYRAWQDPEKHTNAQACINQVIASRGAAAVMYESNLNKNKFNLLALSLDEQLDNNDNASDTYLDTLVDLENLEQQNSYQVDLVQNLIDNNYVVESIIMDRIAETNCLKYDKTTTKITNADGTTTKVVKNTREFWPYQLVRELNNLSDDYTKYFTTRYKVKQEKFDAALNSLKTANNSSLYTIIENSRAVARGYFA